MIQSLTNPRDLQKYDTWVRSHPEGSLWQSLEWKRYQEALGREVRIYAQMEGEQILASALVVIDRTAFGWSTRDIPRGPIGDAAEPFLKTIVEDAQRDRCLSIFLSPAHLLPPTPYSLRRSSRHEQPSCTRVIDLTQPEEDILRQMKPKGRYNISVAEKNGVRVQESDDIDAFYALLKETQRRDKFSIHPKRHYEVLLRELPESFLILASSTQGEPIAGLLGVIWGKMGIYYYGASDHAHRALMAPYALQWAAMRRCKAVGCASYDLLGIAPPQSPDHPWQGVSAFKEKFGGEVVTYPPEQQIVLRPVTNALLGMKRKLLG